MKRALFLLGMVLCTAAFFAAAAEMAAQAMDPDLSWAPGAADVWRTLSPDTYEGLLAWHGDAAWLVLLKLPGWLILGVPGLAMVITFRKQGPGNITEHEESLYLYDELAKQSHAEGFTNTRDDLEPTAYDDVVPAEDHYAQDDVLDDVRDEETDGATPSASGKHDYLLGGKPQNDS